MTTHDVCWEDAGGFLFRFLPPQRLATLFSDERDMVTIHPDQDRWWLRREGVAGETPCDSLEEAKCAGDGIIAVASEGRDGALLEETELSPEHWRVDDADHISFREIDGVLSIHARLCVGADGERWDVLAGDHELGRSYARIGEAVALCKLNQ